jgi:hypothetical protein
MLWRKDSGRGLKLRVIRRNWQFDQVHALHGFQKLTSLAMIARLASRNDVCPARRSTKASEQQRKSHL